MGAKGLQSLVEKAVLQHRQGKPGAGLKTLEKALKKSSKNPALLTMATAMAVEADAIKKAVWLGAQAVKLPGATAEAWVNFGVALERNGEPGRAMDAYTEALKLDSRSRTANENLCVLLYQMAKLDAAERQCQTTLELFSDSAEAYLNLSMALLDKGKRKEALEILERGANGCVGNAHILCNLGMLQFDRTDLDVSARTFWKALKLAPQNAYLRFFLGMVRDLQGSEAEARQCFEAIRAKGGDYAFLIDSWFYMKRFKAQGKPLYQTTRDGLQHAMTLAQGQGLILEFGVRFGRSARILASLTDQIIHGFDSFEGLPEDWAGVGEREGAYSTGGQLPPVPDNVSLHKGWFDQTLPAFLEEHPGPIRLINIDCDIYSSTKTVFDCLHDRIVPGTVVVFDEYLFNKGWRDDEHKAFQDACDAYGWKYDYAGFSPFTKQAVVVVK